MITSDLDTDLFTQMLNEDNDIGSVLKFCGEVLFPELADEGLSAADSSFASDDDFSVDEDEEPDDFAAYCRKLSQMTEEEIEEEKRNVKMSSEDKMGMFTVQSKYSKGSVEVSRGSRMSVFPAAQVRKKRYSRMSKIAEEAGKRAQNARKTTKLIEKKMDPPKGMKKLPSRHASEV